MSRHQPRKQRKHQPRKQRKRHPVVAVDFDGTLVDQAFPQIGDALPEAIRTLQGLHARGWHIVLWTSRTDEYLAAAHRWCLERLGFELAGINHGPFGEGPQHKPTFDLIIDDKALGVPLDAQGNVDWRQVRCLLHIDGNEVKP